MGELELEKHARALRCARRRRCDHLDCVSEAVFEALPVRADPRLGWRVLGDLGFEVVRMVAIDEDWSAKRFRRPAFIKNMKRDRRWEMSKAGKAKASKKA